MASLTPVVFLSSRFEEFQPIRERVKRVLLYEAAIPCRVIDLAENYPDNDPPWLISQDAVKAADIMVLLVGHSYGTPPAGHTRSYVHLEYEAACNRGSKIAVLPYFFDAAQKSDQPDLRRFCDEIIKRNTYSELSFANGASENAFQIVQHVQRKALSLLSAVAGTADIGMPADEMEDPDRDEGLQEDRRIANHPRLSLEPTGLETWSEAEILAHPARVAAGEQNREAAKALQAGEWRRAAWHLGQALERQPWELASLYWSARLRLVSGRLDDSRRALALALRAARVADNEVQGADNIPLAASCILASRAAAQLDDSLSAAEYAGRAVKAARHYWLTHYEMARQHAQAGDARNVVAELRSTFYLRPGIWQLVAKDATFVAFRTHCDDERRRIDGETRRDVDQILQKEAVLWSAMEAFRASYPGLVADLTAEWIANSVIVLESQAKEIQSLNLPSILERAKGSFHRQVDALTRLAQQILSLKVAVDDASAIMDNARKVYRTEAGKIRKEVEETKAVAWNEHSTLVVGWMMGVLMGSSIGLLTALLWGWWGVLLGALVVVAGRAAAKTGVFHTAERATERALVRARRHRLKQLLDSWKTAVGNRKAACDPTGVIRTRGQEALRTSVPLFVRAVHDMEAACLKRRIYSPTPGLDRAKAGEMVVLKPAELGDQYTFQDQLVPDSLAEWLPDAPLTLSTTRLYRLLQGSDKSTASRQHCYFNT